MTLRVTTVFEQLGIPYLVGGSLASSLHGKPRATQDVDLVADLQRATSNADRSGCSAATYPQCC